MTRNVEERLRGIAGTFILVSLALGWFVHPAFFLFTAFVGANLLQSAFSRTCPMMWFLRRLGVRPASSPASRERAA
jgi:Inner membrane protein YgaP-like, transmembrane domain